MKAAIYTAYHKTSPLIKGRSIHPMHVGRAKSHFPLRDMIGDNTGDNISKDNGKYCELTAMYWAWKNDAESSHIGLMHYRRLLDFAGQYPDREAENFIGGLRIADYVQSTEAWIDAHPDVDLVIPKLHPMPVSVRENYAVSHDPQDIDLAEKIVKARHPAYAPYFTNVMEGRVLRLGNMFLARADIFRDWCSFVFDVLDEVDATRIPRKYVSGYQTRYLGFVAERLFSVFVEKLLAENPNLKVLETNIINLSKATCFPYVANDWLNGPENVNIAFSADDAYLPHAAAMIISAAEHFSPLRTYNLFFLYSGIKPERLELFTSMFRGRSNVGLHLFDVGDTFKGSYRATSKLPSTATYNRFLLFELLPGMNRLLYLDCDMIVTGDLAEVFDTDMGGKPLAAVPDFIMTRTLTSKVETRDPGVPDLYAYQRDVLGMDDDQIANYFNAGLLILNFEAMGDVVTLGQEFMEKAKTSRFFFQDQDILNSHFKGNYLRLPGRFNVFNSLSDAYGSVPEKNHGEAMIAKSAPLIVHYASADFKPWDYPEVENAHLYWNALQKTPFFAKVMLSLKNNQRGLGIFSKGYWFAKAKALAARYPWMKPFMLKVYRTIRARR